jgi:membrane-bound lytic murein transglycosylase A
MKKYLYGFALAVIIVSSGFWGYWYFKEPKLGLKVAAFHNLPGWDSANLKQSLRTFQTSCQAFLKQDPDKQVGSDAVAMQVKDWQPACEAAMKVNPKRLKKVKNYFQTWFLPVQFYEGKPVKGLFTGYYMPLLKGSLKRSKQFNVPLYKLPRDLVMVDLNLFDLDLKNKKIIGRVVENRLIPYYTRAEITKGAIKKKADVLLWIESPIDRLFLEIQGSGVVALQDGSQMYVGYDGQNGAPYTAIAGVLIKKGVMTKDTASMQAIKRYLTENPAEMTSVINENKSFVFFKELNLKGALGSQGVALTPGYSLAIDKQWIPMGAPLWLNTTHPDHNALDTNKPFKRLMVAQDTGGAIKGTVRGDVFWGSGKRATAIAGHMKNEGYYWLLLPRPVVERTMKVISVSNHI